MNENELKNEADMRAFLIKKYIVELFAMLIVFSTIVICRYVNFMDNPTLGALIGVALGYFVADIRKIHS
jgi:hypothetical protein